ncbi:MAG TPA: protein-methionine-sulfoxide reductase catalytic subunit MsrP, partial [Terriglobales bacterium]|nr:protein-methionine-sulfoxide reductase catalytic subunit MsrP [Terriglobales bacterium]
MLIKKAADILSSEITPQSIYLNRRKFLTGAAAVGALAVGGVKLAEMLQPDQGAAAAAARIDGIQKSAFSTDEKPTPFKDITNYNNYYEFSTDKYEPAGLAAAFHPRPWTVKVEGLVKKPQSYDLDTILKMAPPEERIYRHRCVEGWSMVIPWVGFPLGAFLKQVEPLGKAQYVAFETVYRPNEMPGQRSDVLAWPYADGLRLDEAMHPLALLCVGMYGETLPPQDGAPVRLVVPWKY